MKGSEVTEARQRSIAWAQWLTALPGVVYLDTETTGLDDKASVCDIAVVGADGSVLLDTLVNPGQPIPAQSTGVHGITDLMVAGAPIWPQIAERLADLIAERPVCIYNARYDVPLINRLNAEHGLPEIEANWQCALLAYGEFDGTPSRWGDGFKWHKLEDVARQFGIKPGGHRALADTQTTRSLVAAMAAANGKDHQ